MNLAQSQPCACPVPLSHLLRMMDTPPDFTPPKRYVRLHKLPMTGTHEPPDGTTVADMTDAEKARKAAILAIYAQKRLARFSKVMAGNGVMKSATIATALHVSTSSVNGTLLKLVNDGLVKKIGTGPLTCYEWMLK